MLHRLLNNCYSLLMAMVITGRSWSKHHSVVDFDVSAYNKTFALIGDTVIVSCLYDETPTEYSTSSNSEDLSSDKLHIGIIQYGKWIQHISTTQIRRKTTTMPISTTAITASSSTVSQSSSSPPPPSSSSSSSSSLPSPSSSLSSSSSSPSLSSSSRATTTKERHTSVGVMGVLNVTENLLGINSIVCDNGRNETIHEAYLYVQGAITTLTNLSATWLYSSKSLRVSWDWDWLYVQGFLDVDISWVTLGPVPKEGGYACDIQEDTACTIQNVFFVIPYHFRVTVKVKDSLSSIYQSQAHSNKSLTNGYNDSVPTDSILSGLYGVFNFTIDPLENVKLDRPPRLKPTNISSRCLNVTWLAIPFFRYRQENYLYKISIKKMDSKALQSYSSQELMGELPYQESSISLCGLNPDSQYEMRLQVKPTRKGYWSDPARLVVRTLVDKPDEGPGVFNTSFWPGACSRGHREVIIYWKDVPPSLTNGRLTQFLIKVGSLEVRTRALSNHVNLMLPCNESQLVEIYSATEAGLTDVPSVLEIPSQDQELNTPREFGFTVTKVEAAPGPDARSVNITWKCKPPLTCNRGKIDIYLCRVETFSTNTCLNDIEHYSVPLHNETFVIDNVSDGTDMFGYALSDGVGGVKGITWTHCVVDVNRVPVPPSGVTAEKDSTSNSVLVQWNPQHCSGNVRAQILGYRVVCCKKGVPYDSASCIAVSVAGSETTALMIGPDEEGTYNIMVMAQSQAGNSTLSAPATLAFRQEARDNLDRNLLIIFAIATLLMISAILAFIIRTWRKRMALMRKDLNLLLVLSDGNTNTNNRDLDSGNSTSHDPTSPCPPNSKRVARSPENSWKYVESTLR